MAKVSKRARLAYVTAAALGSTFIGSPAWASCVSQAPVDPKSIICDNIGANGWEGSATDSLKVIVNAGSTVLNNQDGTAPPPALITTGLTSSLINNSGSFNNGTAPTYGIDAGSAANPAISVGGGSQVTNNANADMRGSIAFGSATGSNTNILNNLYSNGGGVNLIGQIDGNVTSAGNTTILNQGIMGWASNVSITQTGAGTVNITNGVAGGYAQLTTGNAYKNGIIWNPGATVISTVGNTTLINLGGGSAAGALINGNVILGTGGTGTSTLTNGSQANGVATINGTVTMSDLNNTITNDGIISGNVTMNGTGSNTYNAGSSGSSGDNGLRLPGAAVGGLPTFTPTGTVVGSLTGLAANSANNTLNLNGTGLSFLQAGSTINNFGVVNKNDSGAWILRNTLDGNAGKLTTINVTNGELGTDNASFLGSAATTVFLSNPANLTFTGSATGTFAGNIVDATGATTGVVYVVGVNPTTLSGTNTYHGQTHVDGGTLSTGSNGALSANSDFTIENGGTLNINNVNTIKSLSDNNGNNNNANTVNIASGKSLTLGSGTWGAKNGTVLGAGTLIKTSTGTFTLGGANAVNLTGNAAGTQGVFQINDGTVNVNAAGAIGANTAVQVNSNSASNPTTTGVLNVNQDDTIGSLNGTGANASVVIASTKTLTTGGLNGTDSFAGHISGPGKLTKAGTGTMSLLGTNTYTGTTEIVGGGTLRGFAGTGAGTSSLQGNIIVTAGNVTFDQTINNANGTYANNLSGAGTATFVGNGTTTLTLSGNNSGLLGAMKFNSGTVAISATNNVGVGSLDFNGGTLRNMANVTLTNGVTTTSAGNATFLTDASTTLTLNGNITGNGQLNKTGAGTLVLGGTNTYTGPTNVSQGLLQGQGGTGLQGNIGIASGAAVKFTGTGVYAGVLSGQGTVEIAPTATTFTGVNTYSGDTTVDAGATLTQGAVNALSDNSGHVVNGTLTLGFNDTIKNLGGASTGVVNIGAATTLTLANIGSYSYGGQLNGPGSLVVGNGGGTWTFASTGTTGTPLLAFTNNGNTILNGSLAATTGTNSATGVLSGNGTFTGAFTNNGTIRPGSSPGIINFVGSYAQGATGTYVADVNANNSSSVTAGVDYDQIHVSGTPGTAALNGNLTINQNGGEFVNGTVYHIITTTGTVGTISGNFSSVNGAVISPFIQFNGSITNVGTTGVYNLTVQRNAYNTVANNPNQAAVAGLTGSTGLQGLVGVANAVSAVARIDNMSASDARSFFDQISPEAYGAYVTALQDQGNLFTRQVAHRLDSAKSGGDAKMAVWGNLYGQWGNGKKRSFRFGSDQDIKGGALGVDGSVGTDLTLGVAGGYSEDTVKYRLGNSKGKSKSWQFGGYASYHPGKLAANVQVAYIHGKVNAGKEVAVGSGFSATSGVATAHTSGNLFKAIGTVGYEVGSETLAFTPFIGVDFTTGHLKGFDEHGTLGPLLLTVGKQKADRTDLLAGFKFAPNMGSLTPYADATLRYALSRNHGLVHAAFDDIPSDMFTVSAQRPGKMQGELDAGLAYAIGKSSSIFFGYTGTIRKSLTEHGVNGGVKFAF